MAAVPVHKNIPNIETIQDINYLRAPCSYPRRRDNRAFFKSQLGFRLEHAPRPLGALFAIPPVPRGVRKRAYGETVREKADA